MMQFQIWHQVKRLSLAVTVIGLIVATMSPARADVAFSQNFDSGPVSLGADTFWSDNSLDNGYVVKTNTGVGPFAKYPITNDASGSGYFLFNGTAGDAPSGQTVVFSATFAVTSNTNYTVSFDLTNANSISVATIQPEIGGVLLGSPVSANGYFTDGNNSDKWQQFSFTWNSGSLTSTTLVLNNFTTTGTGNDFGIDNILVATPTPEPSTIVVAIAGALGMIAYGQRWRKARNESK